MSEQVELKNCPFCGGGGDLLRIDSGYFVRCEAYNCCQTGFIKDRNCDEAGEAKELAIRIWNTRLTQPDHIPDTGNMVTDEMIEKAEKELKWLKDTAEDNQDSARIVGYEDCLNIFRQAESLTEEG